MGKPVSIQDIAQAAGVSHTTVSRALRDSSLISLEVREQIQRLAAEMGYIPNAVAQSLRGQRTNTIGVVVTTIADPFVGRVVRGIEEVTQRYNLSMILSVSNNDPDREVSVMENFHRRRVDGIIVTAARLTEEHKQRLDHIPVPTILINQQNDTPLEHLCSVSVDDQSGARLAVQHLLSLGHRAIGYLGAGNRPRSNRVRLQSYRDTLKEAGITSQEGWVRVFSPDSRYYSDDTVEGFRNLPALLESGVTAIFCYNDMVAVGVLLACARLGIRVPEQLSIVGYDDVEVAQFVAPPLTTIHQPKLRLGQLAMEMLVELMEEREVEDHVLPVDLVTRGSSGPVPSFPLQLDISLAKAILSEEPLTST